MRICLHTRGLTQLDPEQLLIVLELAAPYRRKALEVFRTPGDAVPEIPEAMFTARDAETQIEFMKYKFMEVLISSVRPGGTREDLPMEQLSLNFHKVEITINGVMSACGKLPEEFKR